MKILHTVQLAALIGLLTLFAACSAMFDEPLPPNPPASEDGIAVVRVSIGGNARTILPDLNFSKYVLNAVPASGNNNEPPEPMEINGNEGFIRVPYGEWIIIATAYVTVAGTDYAAANGRASMDVWDWQDPWDRWVHIYVNTPRAGEVGQSGTFAWTVTHPDTVSVNIKLIEYPNFSTGSGILNESDDTGSKDNVYPGLYYLTVTAGKDGTTVTRTEIVHIYDQLTTTANYVFTKLDFGDESLSIGGTIKVLIDGALHNPHNTILRCFYDDDDYSFLNDTVIDFGTETDGSGTWSMDFSNHLHGAHTLYFWIDTQHSDGTWIYQKIASIPVPSEDATDIDLGDFDIQTLLLSGNVSVNVDGNPATISYYDILFDEDWYSAQLNNDNSWTCRIPAPDSAGEVEIIHDVGIDNGDVSSRIWTSQYIDISNTTAVSNINHHFDLKTVQVRHHYTVDGSEPYRVYLNGSPAGYYEFDCNNHVVFDQGDDPLCTMLAPENADALWFWCDVYEDGYTSYYDDQWQAIPPSGIIDLDPKDTNNYWDW